jgi:hypothetical protein
VEALAQRCADARATALFALTYDGRIELAPWEPEDALVVALVNRHQLGDKGFGPALGPAGASYTQRVFERWGYRVLRATSDWRHAAEHAPLQQALLEGWIDAATEMAPEQESLLRRWHERRRAHLARGDSVITVGHVDLLASPPHSNDTTAPPRSSSSFNRSF